MQLSVCPSKFGLKLMEKINFMFLCHLCSVAGTQFPYTQSSNPTPSSHNAGDALRHRQRAVIYPSLRKEATRPAVSGCGGQGQGWSRFGGDEGSKGFRKRARVEPEVTEDCEEEEETEAKQQTPFITARDQYVSWKAENQSGPTQNQVMEIAWIVQKCNNILLEILKFVNFQQCLKCILRVFPC